MREAGAEVELLAPEAGEVQAFEHLDKGETFTADRVVADADAAEGRTVTSWPSLRTDLRNAGAEWVAEGAHV